MPISNSEITELSDRIAHKVWEAVLSMALCDRWLSLKRAAQYSSIGQKRLIKLAQDGEIVGFQDTDSKLEPWIFDRLSIDKYRQSQADEETVLLRQKAIDILKSVGAYE